MIEQPEADKPNTQPPESNNQSPTDQNPDHGSIWYRNISRRDALKLGVTLVGTSVAVAAGKGIADILVPPRHGPEQPKSPELQSSDIDFGFNTHLHAVSLGANDNMNLEGFKSDVDTLVSSHQSWVRFDLRNNGAVETDQTGKVSFSDKIAVYDQAVEYAKQKGLRIALATSVPDSLASLPINEYVPLAVAFYSELASRYKDKIDTWQIFNEADTHHFRDYHDISQGIDQTYLNDLARVVAGSAEAIKALSPGSKVTMNASLWAPDKSVIRERTSRFFDAVGGSLDFISLDPYPDVYDPNSAQTIPADIEFFQKRYNKDIVIAEIGVSSHDISDPARRASILVSQLSAIKGGNVRPKAVFVYEMRNEDGIRTQDPREASFGTADIMGRLTQQMQTSVAQSSTAQTTA